MSRAAYRRVYVSLEAPTSTETETARRTVRKPTQETARRGTVLRSTSARVSELPQETEIDGECDIAQGGFGRIEARFFELGEEMSRLKSASGLMLWEGEWKGGRNLRGGWLGVSAIVLGILFGVTAFVIHAMR